MAGARPKSVYATPIKLGAFVVAMFGFGFALSPLYNVFCEITGLNGKTGVVGEEVAMTYTIDESREVTVEFVANLNQDLNWEFVPEVAKMRVNPGRIYTVNYFARNREGQPIVGQAVPSVAPNTASRYFNKVECFCFTQQQFNPGEGRDMPVSFVIDPKLPASVNTVTLSYTFFDTKARVAMK